MSDWVKDHLIFVHIGEASKPQPADYRAEFLAALTGDDRRDDGDDDSAYESESPTRDDGE